MNASQYELSDMHIHLQDPRFGASCEEAGAYVERARRVGVIRALCASVSPGDWNRVAELGRRCDGVYVAFGVHPWQVGKISGDWVPILADLLVQYVGKDGETKAILGEVGLDAAVRGFGPELQQAQETALRSQLDLAASLKIPVVLHSVRANDRLLGIMREYAKIPAWLLHGWTATPQEIDRAVDLGSFFSFSSRSVAPNSVRSRATIASVPRDRILLESDGPTLVPPKGYAGTPSEFPPIVLEERKADGTLVAGPESVLDTLVEIASIRTAKVDELAAQIRLNEERFFRLIPKKTR